MRIVKGDIVQLKKHCSSDYFLHKLFTYRVVATKGRMIGIKSRGTIRYRTQLDFDLFRRPLLVNLREQVLNGKVFAIFLALYALMIIGMIYFGLK